MLTEASALIKVKLVAIPDPILERNAIVHVEPLNCLPGNSDGLWQIHITALDLGKNHLFFYMLWVYDTGISRIIGCFFNEEWES